MFSASMFKKSEVNIINSVSFFNIVKTLNIITFFSSNEVYIVFAFSPNKYKQKTFESSKHKNYIVNN